MLFFIKTVVSGLLIALSSTFANKYPGPSAVVIALPFTTLITLGWLSYDGKSAIELGTFLQNVGWITVSGLGLFFITPFLIKNGWSFWSSFAVGILSLIVGSFIVVKVSQ
jgi:hypothetical protein